MFGQFFKDLPSTEDGRRRGQRQLLGDVLTKPMISSSVTTAATAKGFFCVLPPPRVGSSLVEESGGLFMHSSSQVGSSADKGSGVPYIWGRQSRIPTSSSSSSSPPLHSREESPRSQSRSRNRTARKSTAPADFDELQTLRNGTTSAPLEFHEILRRKRARAKQPPATSSDSYFQDYSRAALSRAASRKSPEFRSPSRATWKKFVAEDSSPPYSKAKLSRATNRKPTGSRSPPYASSRKFVKGDISPPLLKFEDIGTLPRRRQHLPNHTRSTLPRASTKIVGYRYTQIESNQVRLLALRAGQGDELIHCSLKPMLVSELEQSHLGFFALSYSWGEDITGAMIHVSDMREDDGDVDESPFESTPAEFYIRPNLHSALKQLRRKDEDLWLWIDAICIDQTNLVEKSHQIPKMLDIYGSAWSVCIWLGETESVSRYDKASHEPLDFVPIIVNLKLLDRIVGGELEEDTLASFVAFASLLKRPWFRRRWVIQEVAASKRAFVQCGEKKVNWIDFADAVELFLENIERIRTIYHRSELARWNPNALDHVESWGAGAIVRAAHSVLKKSDWGKIVARLWDIESLVVTFLHYEATDTRDTIYALLALAKDKDAYVGANSSFDLQDQSYKKSTAQIYAEFIDHTIRSKDSLDIICRHWALSPSDASGPELPKWVGLATESSFGSSSKGTGRLKGDSLVGKPGFVIYNTSHNSRPDVRLYIPDSNRDSYDVGLSNPGGLPEAAQSRVVISAHQMEEWILVDQQNSGAATEDKVKQRRRGQSRRQKKLREAARRQKEDDLFASDRSGQVQNDIYTMAEEPETLRGFPVASDKVPVGKVTGIRPVPYNYLSAPTSSRAFTKPQHNWATWQSASTYTSALQKQNNSSLLSTITITLCAKGFRLCEITEFSRRVADGIISRESLKIAGWYLNLDINDIPDRLWRTLVADRTDTGAIAPAWWRRACMHCLSKIKADGDLNTANLIGNKELPETVKQFLKRVQATVWNRKFFAASVAQNSNAPTPLTLYGLGSRSFRKGDWCCVLFGCSVPVVLREEKEKPYFKFLGECYIDGMMDGQAMGIMKERGLEVREFAMR